MQSRLDKSLKLDAINHQNTLYALLQNGMNLSLHAVKATLGRFGVNNRQDSTDLYIEWALDGESLYRGDRIIECNGKVIVSQTKDEFLKQTSACGKCELVVIRKRTAQQNHQLLLQSQEDNQRLQHRISYLEDQVKELQQSTKEMITAPIQNGKHTNQMVKSPTKNTKGDHVTSISISSTPIAPKQNEKPQIFQRGNFVATIIGGKAIQTSYKPTNHIIASNSNTSSTNSNSMHTTKTVIKDMNGCATSDSEHDIHYPSHRNGLHHSQSQQYIGTNSNNKLFGSASKISIGNDTHSHNAHNSHSMSKHKEKQREHYKENRSRMFRESINRHNSHPNLLNGDVSEQQKYVVFLN